LRLSPRHDLRCSMGDAGAYSVMVGIGETYFAAFALAIGTGRTFAGIIATMPMLAGAFLQLATPWAVQRFGSHKHWVVACASTQAASLLLMPLALLFVGPEHFSGALGPDAAPTYGPALWVFLAATIYWGAGLMTSPARNTWIDEIIPKRVRTKYFACRQRISQTLTLVGFIVGGIALQSGKSGGWLLPAFVGIFLVASACRFLSAGFLSQQSEPSRGRVVERRISLRQMLAQTRSETSGTLVVYLLAVQTAVQISGPYFTPYMLSVEKMSYFNYMLLVGVGFLGKVIALPLWGRVAQTAGPRRLLWIGGAAIVPIASLWCFGGCFESWSVRLPIDLYVTSFQWDFDGKIAYYTAVQLLSGITWAAYELAMMLMFFEAIPRQDRTSVLTFYNFGNAAAMVVGGLIGATILQCGSESQAAFLTLFAVSSLMRLSTLCLLFRAPQVPVTTVQPALRVVSMRPDDSVSRPILSTLPDGESETGQR
jgi:MFS family permease